MRYPCVSMAGLRSVALALGASASIAASSPPAAGPVDHYAAGKAAAQPDFAGLGTLCDRASPAVTAAMVKSQPWQMPPGLPPARVFDNLYFLGNRFVSAWAIRTSAGIILIDALDNEAEAKAFIEDGMRKLGLDPAQIRYLVITHAHGDHYGGAPYLVAKYRPKVVMSARDWAMLKDPSRRIDAPGWADVPMPDLTFDRETVLALGDTKLKLFLTPGHTLGTLSLLFDVTDAGTQHRAILWGGTGFNFGPDAARYALYARSAEATRVLALREGVDVFLSNHVKRDEADKKIALLAARQAGQPHPFVLPPERTAQAFTVFRECALAQAEKLKAQ